MTIAGLLLVLLIAALGVRIAWILARPKPIERDEHETGGIG